VWQSTKDRDPYQYENMELSEDEIDERLSEDNADSEELDELLEKRNCAELMPLVQRILWLGNVKEALGYIPDSFSINYIEIKGLVLLKQEQNRKMAYDSWQLKKDADNKTPRG
jgi:hypothetical protein